MEKVVELELRKLTAAAYMAHYYGVSRDEIQAALEQGIAEAEQLLEKRRETDRLLANLHRPAPMSAQEQHELRSLLHWQQDAA